MSDTDIPNSEQKPNATDSEPEENFGSLLAEYEQSHSKKARDGEGRIIATVISVSSDRVLVDIGYKIEGALNPATFPQGKLPMPGDRFPAAIKGRNEDGYYDVSILRGRQPADWESLQRAFTEQAIIIGTVTGLVKGGLTVDVGVRAFLPASRSGTHDAAEMEKLVGSEIRCRLSKVDIADEDVVVDRRSVLEQEQRADRELRLHQLREGDVVSGTVRSLVAYGAFIDLGGIDGLLHVGDIAWTRVNRPEDVLSLGQTLEAVVLKVDPEAGRISLGLKQLQADPWANVEAKYHVGDRVHGVVTRTAEFGAFVELEPGIEGLIHLSEMSWTRKVRKPEDVVKSGDAVDVLILSVSQHERRIGLGLKQALGDPWATVAERFPVGSIVEGPVTSFTAFGAFVQIAEGVEGMVHISEIGGDRRLHHPQEALKLGQPVRAQVLQTDVAKRQMKLSIRKAVPVSLDEYLAEHKSGDLVTGRVTEIVGSSAHIELGEGIQASCQIAPENLARTSEPAKEKTVAGEGQAPNLSSLTAMLQARWKGNVPNQSAQAPDPLRAGQIRRFRIARLDASSKSITLELAG